MQSILIKSILATLGIIAPAFLLIVGVGVILSVLYRKNKKEKETIVNYVIPKDHEIVWENDIPVLRAA